MDVSRRGFLKMFAALPAAAAVAKLPALAQVLIPEMPAVPKPMLDLMQGVFGSGPMVLDFGAVKIAGNLPTLDSSSEEIQLGSWRTPGRFSNKTTFDTTPLGSEDASHLHRFVTERIYSSAPPSRGDIKVLYEGEHVATMVGAFLVSCDAMMFGQTETPNLRIGLYYNYAEFVELS